MPYFHLAFLFVQLNFAIFPVVAKGVMQELDPLELASFRVLGAAPLLLLAAHFTSSYRLKWADLGPLALLGFLGVTSNQILFILGLQRTTATNAAVLMPTIPVFTAAAAALFGVEKLTGLRIAGVALAFLGALVMADLGNVSLGSDHLLGNVLLILNCICYAGFLVLQRPVLQRIPPLPLIAWSFALGGLGVLLFSLPMTGGLPNPANLTVGTLAGMGYIVLFPTALNYFINSWAINKSSPIMASVYIMLQPVITAVLAAFFLSEVIGFREGTGFFLILAGLAVVVCETQRRLAAARNVRPAATVPDKP